MVEYRRYLSVAVAVILGIILQGALILADCKDTPARAAVEFIKAFYRLDPTMSERLCKQHLSENDSNAVKQYILKVSNEAQDRGLGLNYMKNILYGMETHTHVIDDTTAEVKLTAKRRVAINPIYALIGKFFLIGKTYKLETLIPVVKEDGKWKVCKNLSLLSGV